MSDSLVIGIDESGKGDFFGPLVVAGCVVTDGDLATLDRFGVRDSKAIAPTKLQAIAEQLAGLFPHTVVTIAPAEYNRRYEAIGNLNKLLAWGHAEVIARLYTQTGARMAISDKFGKPELIENELVDRQIDLNLRQLVRGERLPAVAAASIIARAAFVDAMAALSHEYGMTLPKGAAPQVDSAGREFVRLFGTDRLRDVAKLHFKNRERVVPR